MMKRTMCSSPRWAASPPSTKMCPPCTNSVRSTRTSEHGISQRSRRLSDPLRYAQASAPASPTSLARSPAELPPVHLPQVRGREGVDENHLARVLVRLQPIAYKSFELFRQAVDALASYDVGVRLDQAVGVGHAHHRHLRHRRVEQQAAFHLGGGEPLARHLEQLVGPAAIGVVAVGVAPDQVSCNYPLAPEAGLALLRLVPVAQGLRPAPHPEVPDGPVGHLPTLLVRHLDLEAGHYLTQCPVENQAQSVGEEDVPHLRGAQAVEQRKSECPVPPGVQLFGQTLSRGGGQAQ